MADNVQHKIARNRPPRVQITYDVEIGNAIEKHEIPFVVGIMADLSGRGDANTANPVALKDKTRSFVEIDRDNFAEVMNKLAPSIALKGGPVALNDDGTESEGNALVFRTMDDFLPDRIVGRVKDLRDMQVRRNALRDVLTKLDSNDALFRTLTEQADAGTFATIGTEASKRLTDLSADDPGLAETTGAGTKTGAAKEPPKNPTAKGKAGEAGSGDDPAKS